MLSQRSKVFPGFPLLTLLNATLPISERQFSCTSHDLHEIKGSLVNALVTWLLWRYYLICLLLLWKRSRLGFLMLTVGCILKSTSILGSMKFSTDQLVFTESTCGYVAIWATKYLRIFNDSSDLYLKTLDSHFSRGHSQRGLTSNKVKQGDKVCAWGDA